MKHFNTIARQCFPTPLLFKNSRSACMLPRRYVVGTLRIRNWSLKKHRGAREVDHVSLLPSWICHLKECQSVTVESGPLDNRNLLVIPRVRRTFSPDWFLCITLTWRARLPTVVVTRVLPPVVARAFPSPWDPPLSCGLTRAKCTGHDGSRRPTPKRGVFIAPHCLMRHGSGFPPFVAMSDIATAQSATRTADWHGKEGTPQERKEKKKGWPF